ncbi:MAG TPA: PilX N-terminal domain-containing pilus assembly protein, partial [Albitalea sp.]
MNTMRSSLPRSQRGAAALIVTLVLFFVMTMIAAYANRNHVFEQRASANQYRAAQAFEAAEAGADWAFAQLNRAQRVDARCEPDASAAASFRERHLAVDAATGLLVPTTWDDAGAPAPLQAVCVSHGSGWDCSCPSDGEPALAAPAAAGPSPAFMVRFEATPRPGVVRLLATGCTQLGGACLPSAGG